MKKFSSLVGVGVSLIACCLVVVSPLAFAATGSSSQPGGGQALEIAPPLLTLTANPGQTIKAQIQLRDVSSGPLLVSNQINDFVANGEDGTPKILLNNQTSPFSIKNWIDALPSFTLQPQHIQTLAINIHVPSNASPGGHYGVIRFTGTPPSLEGSGVSLSASLGALVLLTVNGKLNDSLTMQQFSVNKNGKNGSMFESAPLNFTALIKNSGNVQEQPTGNIKITDMFGKTLATVNVNLPPHYVLPDSVRKFDSPLDKTVIGSKRLFGRYHAVLSVKYGATNDKTLTASLTFWVIPWKLIIVIVVLLIAAFFGLRFVIKRYNRRIISRAQNGNTRSRPPKSKKK